MSEQMPTYLDELNEQQRAAVEYIDGPQLVIAGAGSGKTRVLTYKIMHLLANGYEPWRILALTFTNKAAREMRERITKQVGEKAAAKIWMGTFHSIFARMLRINADRLGYKSNYTIYDSSDSKSLIKTIIRDLDLDEKIYKPSTVANDISQAKNALFSPEMYAADREMMAADARAKRPRTAEIYRIYRDRCRVADAMDFDDLLFNTNILLRDNDDIRRHYQEYFRYILVDEYQDTNFAQHAIVQQLSGEHQHVCVVGDDAQSIYSFRGANIGNILGMKRWFPTLQTYKLEQNYRSTQNIINAAGTLIAKNSEQIPKNVFSKNGVGRLIDVVQSYSDYEESFLVANAITRLKREGGDPYSEFAVLYRTNAQSRVLEESLRKRNIPYRIYGGTSFYQRKEVKDAVAYFRLAINPDDDEALKRVINYPARGIGDTTLKKLIAASIADNVSIWQVLIDPLAHNVNINKGTLTKLQGFASMISGFNALNSDGVSADQLARAIYIQTKILDQYRYDNTPENISKRQNLDELLGGVASFVDEKLEQGLTDEVQMASFMAEVSLATDADVKDGEVDNDRVTLMTIHSAKGLEFNNVMVVGVERDLLPSAMSMSTMREIEEERRLLYVAITRAKSYCMLSYAKSRFRNGQTVTTAPSPFLRDIDPHYLRMVTGSSTGAASTPSAPMPPRPQFANPWRPAVKPTTAPKSAVEGESAHDIKELRVGMLIKHAKFGVGTIASIDADNPNGPRITVKFDNVEVKTLLLKFAKFKILED